MLARWLLSPGCPSHSCPDPLAAPFLHQADQRWGRSVRRLRWRDGFAPESHLLKSGKLFGTDDLASDLSEIHGANLTDHCLDAAIMGGDIDDMSAAEAGAPNSQLVCIDFRLK